MSDSKPPSTPAQRQQQMTIAVAVVIFVVFVAFMFILLLNANQPQQAIVDPEQLAAESGFDRDGSADSSADTSGGAETADDSAAADSASSNDQTTDDSASSSNQTSDDSQASNSSADVEPTPDLPDTQEEAIAAYAAAGIDINAILNHYGNVTQSESERGTPVLGDPAAPITVSEFSSFTCGHCADFHGDQFETLLENEIAEGSIKFELISVARNDFDAVATAAITCAAEQDRLWEMFDLIFDWVVAGGEATLSPLHPQIGPQALGIDSDAYLDCMNSDPPFEQVQANTDLFRQYINDYDTVTGTPTLLFNGDPTVGSGGLPIENIREVLASLQ